jgi:GNAT superfamily N-acetyltransferase
MPTLTFRPSTLAEVEVYREQAMQDGAHLYEGSKPIRWFVMADEHNEMLGSVGLLIIGREARIRGWFVRREYRGRGLGKLLLEFAVDEARSLGCTRVEAKTAYIEELKRWGWTHTGKVYTTFKPRSPGWQFILNLKEQA